ncbi:MAG: hypothetical protein JXQ75_04200 [Phycisphaerae bacterium]|nr:hypothetical protein [Phycisphaerae bacterium]
MIDRIGVICQDANSLGFLQGLKARLKCEAELIKAPATVGKSTYMTKRQAKNAWAFFREKGVDRIIRFTDADDDRWQSVRREEPKSFDVAARSILVCGVAVRNTEHWLNLMQDHLAKVLRLSVAQLRATKDPTDLIKAALKRIRRPDQNASDVVAGIVERAPPRVFQSLLKYQSFRTFYNDCRAEALKADCEVPNELADQTKRES